MSRSVFLILLDTLRADMLERGDILKELPTLKRLSKKSLVFTQAYAPSHWTLPSHASVFTGLPPHLHEARPPRNMLREDIPTIAEEFSKRGYVTACVSCNPYLSSAFGTVRGFDFTWQAAPSKLREQLAATMGRVREYHLEGREGDSTLARLYDMMRTLVLSSPMWDNGGKQASRLVERFLKRIDDPVFLVVNLMEAHQPYYARGPFSSWKARIRHAQFLQWIQAWNDFRYAVMAGRITPLEREWRSIARLYWEGVRHLDFRLQRLLEVIEKRFENGLIIVLSDHGQLLGEGGCIDHVAGLQAALIKVPLFIRPLEGVEPERVDSPIETTWLFSLLKGVALGNDEALPNWLLKVKNSRAVMAQAHAGIVEDRRIHSESNPRRRGDLREFKNRHDQNKLVCISGGWKLVCHLGRRPDELFDIQSDTEERENRALDCEDLLRKMHETLRETMLSQPTLHDRAFGT